MESTQGVATFRFPTATREPDAPFPSSGIGRKEAWD